MDPGRASEWIFTKTVFLEKKHQKKQKGMHLQQPHLILHKNFPRKCPLFSVYADGWQDAAGRRVKKTEGEAKKETDTGRRIEKRDVLNTGTKERGRKVCAGGAEWRKRERRKSV